MLAGRAGFLDWKMRVRKNMRRSLVLAGTNGKIQNAKEDWKKRARKNHQKEEVEPSVD